MLPQGPVAGGFVESWVWLGTDRRILVSRGGRAKTLRGGGGADIPSCRLYAMLRYHQYTTYLSACLRHIIPAGERTTFLLTRDYYGVLIYSLGVEYVVGMSDPTLSRPGRTSHEKYV